MARNTQILAKWEMHTAGPRLCEKAKNHGKWEIHIVAHGVWQENWK